MQLVNHIDLSSFSNVAQSESRGSKSFLSNTGAPGPCNLSLNPPLGLLKSANIHRSLTFFSGIHLLSDEGIEWIEHQVGDKVNCAKLNALELPWTCPRLLHDDATILSDSVTKLPCREIVELYVSRYTSSFQSLVFPVISKSIFTKTLDLAYGPPGVFGYASARACVWSFLSLVGMFGFDINTYGAVDCGSYISEARGLLPSIIHEMTVDGLQSLVMLVQIEFFLGDLQSAAVSISIATRLLYKLGTHTASANPNQSLHPSHYDKSRLECHMRDLFWVCYSFDKDICLRIGQPPSINDSECDLSLPLEYARLQNLNMLRDNIASDDRVLPLFPWDIRLSMIKSEAYTTLYSAKAHFKSDSEVLESIRHLDAALEQWRLSLEPEIRPLLCHTPDTSVRTGLNTQQVMLCLAYYHCVSIIHQASDRRNISGLFHAGIELEGISSSATISTTASRSTLSLLQTTLPSLKGECFWVVLFYILTANLSLFCKILRDPLQPESSHDVNILQDIPALLNKIPIRYLTPAEIMHLKFLNGFTAEFARLAMCATSKAQ
ncbi:hypothetical protein MW887_004664 [Aspergillus wentii]|nr:hypothetical protein MW887_004664 [Aspergillus wentii]